MNLAQMMSAELDAIHYPFGKRAPYRCPACDSTNIARERNETTYYPEREVSVEIIVRCTDCGHDDDYTEVASR